MAIGFKADDLTDNKEKAEVDSLETEESEQNTGKNRIIIIVCIAIMIILIVVVSKKLFTKTEDLSVMQDDNITTQMASTEVTTDNVQSNNLEYSTEEQTTVGLPQFNPKTNGTTTAIVYSANDYIKDLNNNDIPAVYEVANRTYVKDFVNYEAKRAIIDTGMEMYWLEIEYKQKHYRCQVPYYVFKDLESAGICVVEIELLKLDSGEEVISYMQVVTDYSTLK